MTRLHTDDDGARLASVDTRTSAEQPLDSPPTLGRGRGHACRGAVAAFSSPPTAVEFADFLKRVFGAGTSREATCATWHGRAFERRASRTISLPHSSGAWAGVPRGHFARPVRKAAGFVRPRTLAALAGGHEAERAAIACQAIAQISLEAAPVRQATRPPVVDRGKVAVTAIRTVSQVLRETDRVAAILRNDDAGVVAQTARAHSTGDDRLRGRRSDGLWYCSNGNRGENHKRNSQEL